MTDKQYGDLDKTYLIRKKKETYGFTVLTDQKRFYQENAPELTVERCTLDEMIMMMIKGDTI